MPIGNLICCTISVYVMTRFLETDWEKQPAINRGLTNDGKDIAEANRKTAV